MASLTVFKYISASTRTTSFSHEYVCDNNRINTWWRHQMETFSALLAICAGNSPVNSPHKGQWRGALLFSLICFWINGWVNNRKAGDLRRYRAHYDVIVMKARDFYGTEFNWPSVCMQIVWQSMLCGSTTQNSPYDKVISPAISLCNRQIKCVLNLNQTNSNIPDTTSTL